MLKLVVFMSCVFLLLAKDVMSSNIVVEEYDVGSGSGGGEDPEPTPPKPTTPPTCFTDPTLCDSTTEFCKTIDSIPQCVCLIGLTKNENGTCIKAQQFAGVFVFTEDGSTTYKSSLSLTGYAAVLYEDDPNIAILEAWLDDTYEPKNPDYLGSVVTQMKVNIEYAYTSSFADSGSSSAVTAESFATDFTDSIDAKTATVVCTDPTPDVFCQLDTEVTKKRVLEVSVSSCDGKCDVTSTECGANDESDGFQCDCRKGYLNDGNTVACTRLTCEEHADCNDPFGTCNIGEDDGLGICDCMTLFNGDNCEDPWLFIFVVVMSFIAFTGFVVFLWCCITSSCKKKKPAKKSKYDDDISMDSLQGLAGIISPKVDKWKVPDSGLRAKVPFSIARVNRAYERDYRC